MGAALGLVMALIWIVVVVYLFGLATRLVNAVEEIARQMGARNGGTVLQGRFPD